MEHVSTSPNVLPSDNRIAFSNIEALVARSDDPMRPPDGWNDDESPPRLLAALVSWLDAWTGTVIVTYACTALGEAQSFADVAYDFLIAAYVGERLAAYASASRAIQNTERRARSVDIDFMFTLEPLHRPAFAAELVALTRRYGDLCLDWSANDWHVTGTEDTNEFEERLWELQRFLRRGGHPAWTPRFPHLCDEWILSFLHGAGNAGRSSKEVHALQPSFADGYVLSFTSSTAGGRIFFGAGAWLSERAVSADAVLDESTADGTPCWRLVRATGTRIDANEIAFSEQAALYVPKRALRAAQPIARRLFARRGTPLHDTSVVPILMSDNGRVLICQDSVASYYFFDDMLRPVPRETLSVLADESDAATETLRLLSGNPRDLTVPWDRIDEETFEKVCYDLVREDFAARNIRLMGNTRSRDGGRDITFTTAALPGRDSLRWVAQCKFTRSRKSLGLRDVRDVGDMLDQYDVGGYVLYTNVVIDAGLSDRLEHVTRKRGVTFQTRAEPELARLLAKFRYVRARYFPA